MFGLITNRCQICGNRFNRTRYKWTIRGKKARVCTACNTKLERRVSAVAFGNPVDLPEVRSPDGCSGVAGSALKVFFGLALLGGISSILSDRKDDSRSVGSTEIPADAAKKQHSDEMPPAPEQTPAANVCVPLFRTPETAVKIPIELGLADISPGRPAWRKVASGWVGNSKIITHKGGSTKVGDVDDEISCIHESSVADHVKSVRWTANVFNPADTVTAPRFKEFCLEYTRRLGCGVPAGLFEKVDPTAGQSFSTAEASFELKRLIYKFGYGWELTIRMKE